MRLGDVPEDRARHVLVYGGSTASGIFMIQILRHLRFIPVATCSPHNFPLVKAAGAAATFDYKSPNCAADIRAFTKDQLSFAAAWTAEAAAVVGERKIRPLRYRVVGEPLEDVDRGLEELRSGSVSGEKLVCWVG